MHLAYVVNYMIKTTKGDIEKSYKPMNNKKVNLYFLLSERCPIGFIRNYVDKKLQIEMDYTINMAIMAISDGLTKSKSESGL